MCCPWGIWSQLPQSCEQSANSLAHSPWASGKREHSRATALPEGLDLTQPPLEQKVMVLKRATQVPTTVALPPTGTSGFKMDVKHIQTPLAGLGWNSGGHIQTVLFRCSDLGSLDREKAEKGIHQHRTMSQGSPAAAQPLLFSVVPPTAAQGKHNNLIFTPSYLETIQNRCTYLHFHTTAVLIIAPGTVRGTLACAKKQSLAEGTGDVPKSRTHIVIDISKHGSYSWAETQTSLVNHRSSPLLFPSSRAKPSSTGTHTACSHTAIRRQRPLHQDTFPRKETPASSQTRTAWAWLTVTLPLL